jgi:dethiobiotin synthetase
VSRFFYFYPVNQGRKIFISGIGTGVGKTIVAAIVTEALGAAYWKPVQAGKQYPTDTEHVRSLLSNSACKIFPESYLFEAPLSPHWAAHLENTKLDLGYIRIPEIAEDLVMEGAGGLYSPLNNNELNIDLIKKAKAEVIVVARHYLGSINHSLLTIDALQRNNLKILGIVFNGINEPSTDYILKYTGIKKLLQIEEHEKINKELIRTYAKVFLDNERKHG